MSSILRNIADFNNLFWAWEKAKNSYRPGDIWFNELEVATFEADLSNNLDSISKAFLQGSYTLEEIQPIPYPKAMKDGKSNTRQTFWVSVRDQVAWLAVTNILGGLLDSKMPFWSYGNRLHISMFYEKNEMGINEPRFGYYRNTGKHIFRKWTQSWPLYRRHVNLTARLISKTNKEVKDEFDEEEKQMIDQNERLEKAHPLKNKYIIDGHWTNTSKKELYWCGLDLEKFYPSINNRIIIENFRKYLPAEHYSSILSTQLQAMLNFRIDYTGWSDSELAAINLENRNDNYPHLPTGLFVAGFLANVAMLAIDEKVNEKLAENQNIAHFRYVDDHLILANNFEEMIKWIEAYHQLLNKSQLGTSFNYNKTEPAALSKYYIARSEKTLTDKDIETLLGPAKVACTLDPDFPTPLMTQTLGKVSRIARTDFNLLTADEEKNLIADVEHLLVTDFPDHELRKDTRVSFAARMLSSMIPKMTINSSKAYEHYKQTVNYSALVASQTDLISLIKDSPALKSAQQELQFYKKMLEDNQHELQRERLRLEDDEKQLAQRAIKLLIKAVGDNHDKVRLWGRLLEFYQKTGTPSPIQALDQLIQLVEKGYSNILSVSFIRSLVMQVLANLVLDAVKIIYIRGYPLVRKKRAKEFLKNILNDEFLTKLVNQLPQNPKKFEQISLKLFQFSVGTALYLIKKLDDAPQWNNPNLVSRYGLINWTTGSREFIKLTGFSLGSFAWFLYNRLPEEYPDKPFLWDEITLGLDCSSPVDLNLALLYPKLLPVRILNAMDQQQTSVFKENEGLLFDIYRGLTEKNVKSNYGFLKRIKAKQTTHQKTITLYEWINWTAHLHLKISIDGGSNYFDPRLGEWAALSIIRQVASEIKEKMNESPFMEPHSVRLEYFRYIHPHNFKLPVEWQTITEQMTWDKLDKLLSSGKIEFRAKDEWIKENRYVPYFGLEKENRDQGILIALGTLLINLLSKETNLPPKWNPLGLQQGWMGLAKHKLKNLALSTITRDIINACFSTRNIETRFQKRLGLVYEFKFDLDTKYDPPQFNNIDTFISYIDLALKRLKNQQLSVSERQPRQLTPINLISLNQSKYLEMINEKEIES